MAEDIPVLSVKGITKSYGEAKILRGVSLDLREGEIKVLIGPSGGGKSTLLQCMNYLVAPDSRGNFPERQADPPATKNGISSPTAARSA